MSIAALILAAGSSSRMREGQQKLLLPLGGQPVLTHVLKAANEAQTRPIIVVLGHQAEQIRQALAATDTHISLIENTDYRQGMSSSLRAGLQSLEHKTGIDGVVILLGDQPLITASLINELIATRETTGKRIVAPLYNGRRGNPVLFDASLFAELQAVTGDEGGRSVIERHKSEIATIEVQQKTAHYDVDTWEAYQQVVEAWQQKAQS